MARKASQKTLKLKADKLAGEACRSRGHCEAFGWIQEWSAKPHKCSGRLEWAHLKSRGICSIRHDPKNCVCLCNICHRHFTQNPDLFKKFIDWLDADRWDYLNEQMQLHKKPDYGYWIKFYELEPKDWWSQYEEA